ncbi:winged helix-turn-helix transcriptional regulator [Mycoplasma sp. CSL10137]|uniref:ArsR/SmtB family transcription factor n=1 Tax=unclassified Mycoplasma TaxID=2683645 RepID=UPI00197B627F|nr:MULTISPECIES: winged helix-turn-helix domain-containing protein [unclassified Mycoplasma]MBN4083363.1 winged helix-turn-helix transcriptional regulator [Mycoplasma sp. CSL10137]MBN4084335.1 winged helix-turn-helix transcriptional regulator [Mycoplasma sp. CSL10166]MBU4692821.1 transcriptional regulator [Mycoplasma sp. CSL7491-lung]
MNKKTNNNDLSSLLGLFSKDIKRKIILHLYSCHENECDVLTLANKFNSKQANISKHLMNLRTMEIVYAKKEGHNLYYQLMPDFKEKYSEFLQMMYKMDDSNNLECECIYDGHEEGNELLKNS